MTLSSPEQKGAASDLGHCRMSATRVTSNLEAKKMTETMEKTVREIAVECPESIRVFEKLGIDYCCGGKKSLRDACTSAAVPLERVVELLQGAQAATAGPDNAAWN